MTEQKFTPWPWRETHVDKAVFAIADDSSNIVANVFDNAEDTGYANARLIAAAPEMYEIVQEVADECDDDCGSACDIAEECEVRRARILIARINGEEENHE